MAWGNYVLIYLLLGQLFVFFAIKYSAAGLAVIWLWPVFLLRFVILWIKGEAHDGC